LPCTQAMALSKSPEEVQRWLSKVHEVQTSRMTPERKAEVHMKAERSQMAEASRRKCKAVKSHAVRSKALVSEGLRQMSTASAPAHFLAVQDRWSMAQQASASRQATALERVDGARAEGAENAMVMHAEDEDDEEDAGMAEVAALVGAGEPSALGQLSNEAADKEFHELLKQLKTEPTGDQELQAKFQLYESYSEEVVKMRATVFGLYEDNKPTLPEAISAEMKRQLDRIDSDVNMGIQDDAREWFVYLMMRQAGANNSTMGLILDNFEKRLEFLAKNDQDECPVCLEKFSAECPPNTLGCCHKVCHECWTHWAAVMNGHPFCPLCKNEEFVETLHRRAST